MNEPLTVYRAKGKTIGLVFLFKYSLNGHLKAFEIAEGELNQDQMRWLFTDGNFPASQSMMTQIWMKHKNYTKTFEVEVSVADISFESIWERWGLKVKREASEKSWNKLSEADKIKSFLSLKKYQDHLDQTRQARAHLVTWLNQKRYNDEY